MNAHAAPPVQQQRTFALSMALVCAALSVSQLRHGRSLTAAALGGAGVSVWLVGRVARLPEFSET